MNLVFRRFHTIVWGGLFMLLTSHAKAQLTADFTANITTGCAPIVVQFTDLSTGGPTQWQWNLGNGTTSTSQHPSTTYILPGTYTVSLTVTNAGGSDMKTLTGYIEVTPSPETSFSMSDSVGACAPANIQFTNMTVPGAPGPVSYTWDFGNGNSSTDVNPSHIYNTPGNYMVTLVATNSNGCKKSLSKPLQVVSRPQANFSASKPTGCTVPHVVSFTNSSTGAATYEWDFGDGGTSTAANPVHTYTAPGTYNVRLIARTSGGCADTFTRTNYVSIAKPTAAFTPSVTSICARGTILFTNTSTGATSYLWNFGDGGATSTAASPSRQFLNAGTFTVTLIAIGSNGCRDTTTRIVTVNPRPSAQFVADQTVACSVPATIQFTNSSTGASSYTWTFGDNSGSSAATNPSHTYNSVGNFTVVLIATGANGCADTLTRSMYIRTANPVASFTVNNSPICAGDAVQFSNNSTGANTYAWTFGNGTGSNGLGNFTRPYTTAGTFDVRLIATHTGTNCRDTAYGTVVVNPKPTAQFTADTMLHCKVPASVNFSNSSTGGAISYEWIFGDGTTLNSPAPPSAVSHSYNNWGTYNVWLVAVGSNGCRDTLRRNSYIRVDTPVVTITQTPAIACAPVDITFGVTLNPNTWTPSNYSWDFGDGGTGTGPNPVHTYTDSGRYTVRVTITTVNGCTFSGVREVQVGRTPDASFTISPPSTCVNLPVTFTSTSTGALTYSWAFGDGSGATTATATHPYNNQGTYNVRLIAINNQCRDTAEGTVDITGPSAAFTTSFPCNLRPGAQFTNTSVNAASYEWDFGDGSGSTLTSPSHTYATEGTYTVRLIAIHADGCRDTAAQNITVTAPPQVDFSTEDTAICKGATAVFTRLANPANHTYTWTFGDGTAPVNTTAVNPLTISHTYNTAGVFTVRLVVRQTATGCSDTVTKTSYVRVGAPEADFVAAPVRGCSPLTVDFTDQSVAAVGTSVDDRTWNFGDGTIISGNDSTPSHTYYSNGRASYTVSLVVTDNSGCRDTATRALYISIARPTAGFNAPAQACKHTSVSFTNTTTNFAVDYIWDFGDGTTSTAVNPVHSFDTAGVYPVRLIAIDSMGCADTVVRNITIHEVIAGFVMSDSVAQCPPLVVSFSNTTIGASAFSWDLGNGVKSVLPNPTSTYTIPGVYTATLWASGNGCSDSISKTITVNGPFGTLDYSPTSGCVPVTINFTSSATNTLTYNWDMNNGVTQSTATGAHSYTYTQPGVYLPVLVLGNGANCNVAIVGSDTIHVNAIEGDFRFEAGSFCKDIPVQFFDTVLVNFSGNVTQNWDFGDGQTGSGHNPIHVYANPGTYSVRLILRNDSNCADSVIHQVTIHDLPPVAAQVGHQTICPGASVQLQATGADTFVWTPAAGLSCTNCPNPIAAPVASTIYTVEGTDANGCTNTDTIAITIAPNPVLVTSPDTTVCSGSLIGLRASGADQYSWSPAAGLSCTSCPDPVVTITDTIVYTVIGTTNFGCADTESVTIYALPMPNLTITPSQSICEGSSVALEASGADAYNWSPATGLSCTGCANPVATPAVTTTYTVTGINGNTCRDSAQVTLTVLALPTVSVAAQSICPGDSATLQASGANTYQWSPATGLSCTNCPDPKAAPATTTVYTVIGTLPGDCADTTEVTVTVHPLPVISAGQDQEICLGDSVQLQASGASSYSWTPAAGLACTNCDNPMASPAAHTTYVVTGTDNNGCSDTASVNVIVNPLPTIIASASPDSICIGDTASLLASGADSYTWTPAADLSCSNCPDPKAFPLSTTTYIVTGTDAKGCEDTAHVVLEVLPLPVLAAQDEEVCIGDSVQLGVTGAVSYQWSPATGLSCTNCDNPMASPAVTTTYTVTGTSATGCADTIQVTVTVHPLPVISAGQDQEICLGESVQLQAAGGVSYQWAPATGLSCTSCPNPTATPTDTTTYVVTGSSTFGCIGYDTVVVNVKPLPTISAGSNQMICGGDTAQLQATGGVSYTWTPSATLSCAACPDPQATPVTPTTYTVTGTGDNGCANTAQVTVSMHPQPVLTASDEDICIGDSVQLQASGAASYSWAPATGLSCTNCPDPIADPGTTTVYTIRGTSSDGCTDSTSITVTVHPIPSISAGNDRSVCRGSSTTLTATGAATYTWTPASGLSCTNCASPSATPSDTTAYRVVGISAAGCRDSAEVTVYVLPLPVVDAGADQLICRGATTQLQASGAASYSWSPAAGLSCVNCADPMATPATPTTYTVTGTDSNGCSATGQVQVQFHPQPPVDAGTDRTICRKDSTQLHASGALSYTWSPAATLSCSNCPDPIARPSATTTYWVTGTDVNGCSDSDQVTVTVLQPATAKVGPIARICEGQTAQLLAEGGVEYAWSPAAGLSCTTCPNPVARPDSTTNYQVVVTHNRCFADTLYQTVEVFPIPTVDLGPDQRIFAGESIRLFANSTHAVTYEWSPAQWLSCTDCISPIATPEHTVTYQVVASNALGCSATDEITITLQCDQTILFVPNTFTPNGDGQNDRFFPHGNGITHVDLFRVYNRWGELVFDMQNMPVNNPAAGWDGTYKGRVLKPDTYVWIVQITCINGEKVEMKGDISLIR